MFPVPERLIQNIAPPADYTSTCGNRNVKGVDVTVDGKEDKKQLTQFGEWPNMCAISMIVSIHDYSIFLFLAPLKTQYYFLMNVRNISNYNFHYRILETGGKHILGERL